MKHLIKFFSLIAFLAIIGSNSSFAQTSDDYHQGNFTLSKYEQDEQVNNDVITSWWIVFEDGTKGKIFYRKSCGKYYLEGLISNTYYPDKTTALKALYCLKSGKDKSGYMMKGNVNCD